MTGRLFIPVITDDTDTITAALNYAQAGWYVGPAKRGSKHPGSVLREGWHSRTTRDPKTIAAWFAGTDHSLFLHVGRSGAVAFDVDTPERIPDVLDAAIVELQPPHQSTRTNYPGRGHYLFAVPEGRQLGNGTGQLGNSWGEIRGRNGVIIVAPSAHELATEGGCYAWLHTGDVPLLPEALTSLLPDSSEATDAATDAEVRAFCDLHTDAKAPRLLLTVIRGFHNQLTHGGARHDAMVTATCWAAREARAGAYSAKAAFQRLAQEFATAMAEPRAGSNRTATPASAHAEFAGITAWAVSQAQIADITGVRRKIEARNSDFDVPLPPEPPPDEWDEVPGSDPAQDDADPDDDTARERSDRIYQRAVDHELRQLRIRDQARRMFRAEQAGPLTRPIPVLLSDLLTEPDEPTRYRIESLLPIDGRVVLAAQFKAGKTTLTGNLVRCLADGEPFLGRHTTSAPTGRIVVLDNEMPRKTLKYWLRDQGITNSTRIAIVPMRGHLGSFDVLDPVVRREWADELRTYEPGVLILDCLRPILDALGLDEDKDAGRVLTGLDEIVQRAGIQELIVVHHMGHTGERSRGSSRIRDWPDVEWRLLREDPDNPASRRFFTAYGRDVDLSESALDYDPVTRHLTLAGGSRAQAESENTTTALIKLLTDNPGLSGRAIEAKLIIAGVTQKAIRGAIKTAVKSGLVIVKPGPGTSRLHYVSDPAERVSAGDALATEDHQEVIKTETSNAHKTPGQDVSALARRSSSPLVQRGDDECVGALIGNAHTLTRTDEPVRQQKTATTSAPPARPKDDQDDTSDKITKDGTDAVLKLLTEELGATQRDVS